MTHRRFVSLFRYVSAVLLIISPLCAARLKAQISQAVIGPAPQITQQIDPAERVVLKGNVHPFAKAQNDLGAAPSDLPLKHMRLILKPTAAQQRALTSFLSDQQNPASPSYHQWLTPSQFGVQYGTAQADIQKIVAWLSSSGFTVESVANGNNYIVFSGTHAQLQSAFHTEIHGYKVNGSQYWANAANPEIPAALAPVVAGFASLNNFPHKALHSEPRLVRRDASTKKWTSVPGSGKPAPSFSTTDGQGDSLYVVTPYDFATIYNVLPMWNGEPNGSGKIDGTGETIAIVSDSNINPADVDYFRATFGLPPKKLNILYPTVNPGTNGDEVEADLDVEWSGAVAKGATIDLVVGEDTYVSDGVADAIAYIINNNLAPIMSVSYGACELALGTSGNLFFYQAWQQAAAQGITAMVAAGDSGSASCDQGYAVASYGLQVSGFASTPYTVAVGGTDFYATYASPDTYWSATNSPTYASALSYIPETVWNDSCANPDVLGALQGIGEALNDSTPTQVCNDTSLDGFGLNTIAGSGGASGCISSDGADPSTCTGGYPKPEWQSDPTGMLGVPVDGVRDLPDVSLMAGNGIWGSFYVYCQSDASAGGVCDINNSLEGAGGTSFASPAFAGIMALVAQRYQSPQGNANYILYNLATKQYSNPRLANACQSDTAAPSNACIFYDVTDGTNSVPCDNGYADCVQPNSSDKYELLPGYDAGPGYDQATGLGSINALNLVKNWIGAVDSYSPTSVTLTASGPTSITYGTNLSVNVTVAAKSSPSGTLSGDIAITSNSPTPSAISIADATLANGTASVQLGQLPVGTYNIYARYAGDSTFAPSVSPAMAITVSPAVATLSLNASRTLIAGNPNTTTLQMTVTGTSLGAAPTGTITFSDASTGSILGTSTLQQSIATAYASTAQINVGLSQLITGINQITALYSGDSNYSSGPQPSVAVTVMPAFAVAINPGALTISAASGSGSTTITVTPGTGVGALAALNFSCPANLPAGLSCVFGPATPGSNGTVSSQLTVQLAAPLVAPAAKQSQSARAQYALRGSGYIAFAALVLLVVPKSRRWSSLAIGLLAISTSLLIVGCAGSGTSANSGGGGTTTPTPPSPTATTMALSASSTTPALNSPVTLTAVITPNQGTAAPTGSVSFLDGSASLGSSALASGSASLTTSTLSIGTHSITAQYQGDSTFSGSTSSASKVDVTFSTKIAVGAADSLGNAASITLPVTVQ